jgi:hypothetical protein
MSDLPNRLSEGDHRVTYRARRGNARTELKDAIDRDYVHVLFPDTRGGSELGFHLDRMRSDLTRAQWDAGAGSVHLEGELTLDGVAVRCIADLDLATVEGRGRLQILTERASP